MAPPMSPGEPRPSPKPEPLGSISVIFLFTMCTLCAFFVLWRRASSIRTVVAHQLKTWTDSEGAIRLSIDDGPPSREFIEDDYDSDNERLADDEPLAMRAEHLTSMDNTPQAGGRVLAATEDIFVS